MPPKNVFNFPKAFLTAFIAVISLQPVGIRKSDLKSYFVVFIEKMFLAGTSQDNCLTMS